MFKRMGIFVLVATLLLCITGGKAVASLTDGLVASYPFNGNANDKSGNGNNGTVNGATLTTDRFGNANSAYSFDGTNDYIQIPYSSTLFPDQFTLSLWAKFNTFDNEHIFIRAGDATNTSNGDGWHGYILVTNNGKLEWQDFTGSTYNAIISYPVAKLSTNTWYHIAIVRSSNSATMFINGTSVGSQSSLTPYAKPRYAPLIFGTDCCGGKFFNGLLDDIRIYNRALSESEIQTLYSECYQETATEANSCGAVSGGSYSSTGKWTDGVWDDNYTTIDQTGVYVTYKKPTGAVSAKHKAKIYAYYNTYTIEENEIPQNCWDAGSEIKLWIHQTFKDTRCGTGYNDYGGQYCLFVDCYNGSSWNNQVSYTGSVNSSSHFNTVYEEGITWRIGASNTSPITQTLTPPTTTTVSKGGVLGPFSTSIANNTSSSYSIYVAPYLYIPDGNWLSLGYIPITLSGSQTLSANNLYLWVPPFAPAGTYYYLTYVFDSSWNTLEYDYFTFTVTSSSSKSSRNHDWGISGWPGN